MSKLTKVTALLVFFLTAFCCEILTAESTLGTQKQEVIKKWKNAVIHLEGLFNYDFFEERMKKNRKFEKTIKAALDRKRGKGEITEKEYHRALQDTHELYAIFAKGLRRSGTAVFMNEDKRMYLITARHVLEQNKNEGVYHMIFFPHRLDTMLSGSKIPIPRLVGLDIGTTKQKAYSFHPKLDLAIISLNTKASNFLGTRLADTLLSLGRSPISIRDVLDEPSSEGVEVFTLGFLGVTSRIGTKKPHPGYLWDTEVISEPTLSFGRVGMFHPELEYFWCDMSAYPGNSGGPVIENGKLVGIVSGQATIRDTGRIPFCKVIKAKYIKDLLQIQVQKDSLH